MAKLPPKHLGCLASSLKRCAWTKYFLGKCQNLLKENSTELFYSCTICNACLEILMRNSGLLATQPGLAYFFGAWTKQAAWVCLHADPSCCVRRSSATARQSNAPQLRSAEAQGCGQRSGAPTFPETRWALVYCCTTCHSTITQTTSPAELHHFLWFHQRLESPKGVESLPKRHN